MKRIEGEWRYFDDKLGIPYPWYTKPCLEFLDSLDFKGKTIFEYGVGDSTKWYKIKGAKTYGIDGDPVWANKHGVNCSNDIMSYTNAVAYWYANRFDNYDVIVIDDIFRDECTEKALQHLKPGGLLIIDNFKQPSVQEHWPLTEKLIEGLPITIYKEPNHEDWQTAVITKL